MEDIANYIRKPHIKCQLQRISFKRILKLYLIYFLMMLFLSGPLNFILKITTIKYWEFDISWEMVIYGVIFAPVYEEILFRLLLKSSLKSLIAFNLVGVSILGLMIYDDAQYYSFILALIILIWNIIYSSTKYLNFNLEKHFSKIYYCSALLFALGHIDNYTGITGYLYILTPIIILPYFFIGLYLGYIRMNFGIKYSILFHMLINLPIFLLFFLK